LFKKGGGDGIEIAEIIKLLKALPLKNFVESNDYKLLLQILSGFDYFSVNESEFQQSIDP